MNVLTVTEHHHSSAVTKQCIRRLHQRERSDRDQADENNAFSSRTYVYNRAVNVELALFLAPFPKTTPGTVSASFYV